MDSKRQLYKPAPKQNVGQKKVRKLVQGTLVSTTTENSNSNSSSVGVQDPDTSVGSLRRTTHGIMVASTVSSDVQDDPSMSPCRAVPALTEFASPRAEPPSQCLDLSDTELNLSSATTAKHQQSIMVCDASHLGSSPDNTEVEVLVEYEDSPARVICHTPSRSEKSHQQARLNLSPRQGASSGRRGPISLVFSSPKAGGDSSLGCSDSGSECVSGSARSLIHQDDKNDNKSKRKPVVKNKQGKSKIISEYSRGIIKEILAEEIGSQDISTLSLYSHDSSPPSCELPRSSSPAEMYKHYPTPATSSISNCSRSRDIIINDMSSESTDIPKPIFPVVNFANESDASADNENDARKDRIDRTPKIEAAMKVKMLKHQNDSDSETCSLYEYVTQKKKDTNIVKGKQQGQESKSNKSKDIAKKPSSAKKKPVRVVASRFMQNISSTQRSNTSVHSKDSILSSSRSLVNVTKPKIMTAKASLKSAMSVNRLLDATKNNHTPSSVSSNNNKSSNTNKKGGLTSTPTQDDSCYPCEIDASSIHPSCTMAVSSDKDGSDTDNAVGAQKSKSSTDKTTLALKLDLQYARHLQAAYLSAHAKKSFKEQEKRAMEQLHGLWQLHEKKRKEVSQSKLELERLRARLQIDAALDATEARLNSLEEKLPQVGVYYANLSSALNNTRHQIATKDIYIPNKTDEEREAYEDKLETTLRESENLLNAITSKSSNAFPPLHQYVASLEAISGNVEESGNELRDGYKDLDVAHGLCSQLSSRMVMPSL